MVAGLVRTVVGFFNELGWTDQERKLYVFLTAY